MRVRLLLAIVPLVAACTEGVLDLLPSVDAGRDATSFDASLDATPDSVATDAGADAPCDGGGCACGLSPCDAGCFDLLNDPLHCGSCDPGCAHYQYCHRGNCECLSGFSTCNGACVDFASNPDHCGACNAAPCAAGEKCENGVCAPGACTGGRTACPVTGRNACVTLDSGVPFCGDCTTVCGPEQICVAGSCRLYAPATPCASCPCAADCTRAVGTPSACCPSPFGAVPICVHASSCP